MFLEFLEWTQLPAHMRPYSGCGHAKTGSWNIYWFINRYPLFRCTISYAFVKTSLGLLHILAPYLLCTALIMTLISVIMVPN